MRINLVGSILGSSGYDNHCKGLFNALYQLNSDIKLDVPLQQGWEQMVNDAELNAITKKYKIPDVTIAITTPQFWRLALGDNTKHFIGFCVWEGDKVPEYWIDYLIDKRVDQIWVPSDHTKQAIINTVPVVESKIRIVPHGVNVSTFYNKNEREKEEDRPFRFIINKGWRGTEWDRGGVQYAIKAFYEEFDKDENVELVLKLNPAYINPNNVIPALEKLGIKKESSKIKFNCSNLDLKQINEMYNESDCFICPTRAEAFDLGSAEAMATGLPIITTNYGGQIEHMDKTCAWFIDYEMEEVKNDVLYEDINWASINVQKLKERLRENFKMGIKGMFNKGNKAESFIQDWTWNKSAKIAMSFMKELS